MDESYSKVEWVLYAFVLPLLFTVVLGVVVLEFLGVDVITRVSHAVTDSTVVRNWMSTGKHEDSATASIQSQLSTAQSTVNQLRREKNSLESQISAKDIELKRAQATVDQLQSQLAAATKSNTDFTQAAAVYAAMSPDRAAQIISSLPANQAEQVLAHMKTDDRASVLANMDPKLAAGLMSQVTVDASQQR